MNELPTDAMLSSADNATQVNKTINDYQQNPLMMRLLQGTESKIVRANMAQEFELGFEHRREVLTMALDTRLHSIREACNHVLMTGKTHLRQQRIEYFGEALTQVEKKMNQFADEFLADMDLRFERLERFKNENYWDAFD